MSDVAPPTSAVQGELDVATVVVRSATLEERCRASEAPATWDSELASNRLQSWSQACARGDDEAFERRLAWDGWSSESLTPRLGATAPAPSALPAWAGTLQDALEASVEVSAELELTGGLREEGLFAPGRQLPFFHVWCGFLRCGRRRLDVRLEAAGAPLRPEARNELDRRLLNDLVMWSGAVLYPSFALARRMWKRKVSPESREGYLGFVQRLLRGGLPRLLEQHATLARQLSVLVDTWVETAGELGERLAGDAEALAATFSSGASLGPVTALAAGLSDRHAGGRQVLALAFEAGPRVIYKPRAVDQEAALQELLQWASERGASVPSPLTVLPRDGYGWVAWVEPATLPSPTEAEEYFRRAGGLLCLSWLLGASDLHAGNVIAGSGGPVLVDCETLMQPVLPEITEARDGAPDVSSDPFAETHLLGCWERDALGNAYDFGGLTGGGGVPGETHHPVWQHSNTDAMRLGHVVAQTPETGNCPLLEGRRLTPDLYSRAFREGYSTTYRALAAERQGLAEGPLERWRQFRVRLLLRPSQLYGTLLARLRTQRYQREGFLGGLLIDALNRAFYPFARKPFLWALVAEERSALEALDVPVFATTADAASLSAADGDSISAPFRATGWEATRSRLAELSEGHLGSHLWWLETYLSRPSGSGGSVVDRKEARDELVAAATSLAETLVERARHSAEDWMLPEDCPTGAPLSLHLYDGACGIALFLAASSRMTGSGAHREAAWRAFAALGQRLEEPTASWSDLPLGACTGLGGMIYALVLGAELLEDETPLDWAQALAQGITEERLQADERLEVASGAAGALFGLAALRSRRPAAVSSDLMAAACRRLASTAGPWRGGLAWMTPVGPNAMGLAHGAAGIGAALATAVPSVDSPDVLELSRAAFAGERPEADAQKLGPELGLSWCHGLAGAGIARAIACRQDSRPALVAAIDDACRAVLESAPSVVDHLCCGNGGRIELLLQAARIKADLSLAEAAQSAALLMLKRRTLTGGFALLSDGSQGPYDPGFFRGLSGIGYQLLRVAHPDELPAVLAFEVLP
jgi:type 2 lantibiotic biosynthesis protein LanM